MPAVSPFAWFGAWLAWAGAAFAAQVVYTGSNAPAAPATGDLPRCRTLSQYGITWTFDREVPVGRFVTGDAYVVGPVDVVAIDPKPLVGGEVPAAELDDAERRMKESDRVRNGSMLNPPAAMEVAYDSGIRNWFRRRLLSVPPIRLQPGDRLVSTISMKQGEPYTFPYHPAEGGRGAHDNSPVRTAAVLTCLAVPQPADAFRPSYGDASNTVYLARNLRRDVLARWPRPANTPDIATWVRVYQRPWVSPGFFGFEQPMENMPHYGQWVGQAQSVAGLMLMLDLPPDEKEPLLLGMVQCGIDFWGLVKNGHPGWEGWGGHGSGRKFPIVFAGLLLGDEAMAAPTKTFANVNFGEDNQTMYGDCWTGAKVCFAGHSGVHADGSIPRPKWGPYEHLHPSQWKNEGEQKNYQSEAYRRANSSSSWPGQALVIRALHAEARWNHDAFFDYVDRWMYEKDADFRRAINERFPDKPLVEEGSSWYHQGQAWEDFVTDLFFAQRPLLQAPIDGWKTGRKGGNEAKGNQP